MKSVVKKWIFITEHVWRGGCHVADRIYSCRPLGNFHHFVSTSRSSMLDPANSVTFLTSIFQFNFWIIKCVLIVVVVGVTCREYAGVVLWAIKSFKKHHVSKSWAVSRVSCRVDVTRCRPTRRTEQVAESPNLDTSQTCKLLSSGLFPVNIFNSDRKWKGSSFILYPGQLIWLAHSRTTMDKA